MARYRDQAGIYRLYRMGNVQLKWYWAGTVFVHACTACTVRTIDKFKIGPKGHILDIQGLIAITFKKYIRKERETSNLFL